MIVDFSGITIQLVHLKDKLEEVLGRSVDLFTVRVFEESPDKFFDTQVKKELVPLIWT